MAFSYTGSALNSLVDGLTNNASPVVTLFNDVKTWLNTDTETAFSTYKQIIPSVTGSTVAMTSGNTYLLDENSGAILPTSQTAGMAAFYIDPADYTANTRTNKYRLRASLLTNATALTATLTYGLYPVTAVSGGANNINVTLGAVVSGSTVAFAAQGANTTGQGNSGDFTAPAAGYYAVGVAVTVANVAPNSAIAMRGILQHRQV